MSSKISKPYDNPFIKEGVAEGVKPLTEGLGKPETVSRNTARQKGSGILLYSQSSFSTLFALTGSGESELGCGTFFVKGCLNVSKHKGSNLFGVDMTNKAYLEVHKLSCHRQVCPICWKEWASREVDRASQRLRAFSLKGRILKPIHVTVSVPHADYALSLEKMRVKVYRALKKVHFLGGMMIFHPKRKDKQTNSWYFSPHFHVIGYGWLLDVRQNYLFSGYVVKNIGVRKNIEGVIWYQLSHAGVDSKHHTITWFGALSYNKLRVKYEKEECVCPLCSEKLVKLIWCGKGDPPKIDTIGPVTVGFFDDPSNWKHEPHVPLCVLWEGNYGGVTLTL